ncbi:SHOCT domain-containing protein [candidate division WOR-3 bacterium]|nr:SHOCT domain-containing protein [candidate division WOR-3 bacterium]
MLVLIDNTTFGNAKDGALFTDEAVYSHNMMQKAQKYKYEEIDSVVFIPGLTSNLIINGIKFLETNFPSQFSINLIKEMLGEIVHELRINSAKSASPVDALKKLKELFEQGLINEAEYEEKRKKYVELL